MAGAAALVRGANTRLTAEQTGDVLRRSAHQTLGTGWNQKTGAGVVDITAAVALARRYDTTPPTPALAVVGQPASIAVSLAGTDLSHVGGDLAGIASYALEHSKDGVAYTPLVAAQATPVQARDSVSGQDRWWYRGTVCDTNHNCASVVKGPTGTGPSASLLSRPALKKLVVATAGALPGRARACLRISFGATAASRSMWTVTIKQTGRKRVPRPALRDAARRRPGHADAQPAPRDRLRPVADGDDPGPRVVGTARTKRRLPRGRACRVPA